MENWAITGANRGLGLELTRMALDEGHRVVAICREPAAATSLRHLREEVGEDRLDIEGLADYLDEQAARALSKRLIARGAPLDVLIQNAGRFDRDNDRLAQLDFSAARHTLEVNALGPLLLARELMPILATHGQARAVHISSIMGSMASTQSAGAYGYRMSKAALTMMVVNLAQEWDVERALVFAVHPGWVRTAMGGPDADLSVTKSATDLMRLIRAPKAEWHGRLLNHDGTAIPF